MSWTQEKIHEIVETQRAYFRTGETLDVSWRIEQLRKLKKAAADRENAHESAPAGASVFRQSGKDQNVAAPEV